MSFNFVADNEEEVPQVELERAVGIQPEEAPEVEAMMSEAEERFEEARYYRNVLKEHLFNDDYSPAALKATAKIHAFCREQMAAVLGMKGSDSRALAVPSVPVKAQFSDEQAKVLAQVANRLLKKPTILESPEPQVRKTPSPSPPTQRVQSKPPAPAVKPKQGASQPPQKPVKGAKRGGTATGDILSIPQADGSQRKYQKMVDPRLGEYWMGENGQHYELSVNEAGQNYMKSLNRQARPVGVQPLPPLNGDMMALVAARQVQAAMDQDAVASGRATGGRAVVVASTKPE